MSTRIDGRRQFLKRAAILAGASTCRGPGTCFARTAAADTAHTFALVGDLHFDRLTHHDLDWVTREKPNDLRQIENYSYITEHHLPAVMAGVKRSVTESGCSSIVQIGDLVEGLCGRPSLAKLHCREAIEFMDELEFGIPIRVTKGNHDVTGPGAVEAYHDVILPWLSAQLEEISQPIEARFSIEESSDLFVYFDAYDRGSLDWFDSLMASREAPETGRVFFVVHPPVVPYNARSSWALYARERDRELRERLYRLLGRHRAIVLCGHLHKYSLVERETVEGNFTQLSISSVAYQLDATPRDLISGVENYGPDLVDLEPKHSPETIQERRAILERERPFIRRFDHGDFWGHGVIRTTNDSVDAAVFQMLKEDPWKQVQLA